MGTDLGPPLRPRPARGPYSSVRGVSSGTCLEIGTGVGAFFGGMPRESWAGGGGSVSRRTRELPGAGASSCRQVSK